MKIKENTEIQIIVQFFLKSPSPCLLMICSFTWRYLNSRIRGVSNVFYSQSYFSGPILVHFTHKYFFKAGWKPDIQIKFSVSKNKFEMMRDIPCFWRMSQHKYFCNWTLKHLHYNNGAALEILMPFWHCKSSLPFMPLLSTGIMWLFLHFCVREL